MAGWLTKGSLTEEAVFLVTLVVGMQQNNLAVRVGRGLLGGAKVRSSGGRKRTGLIEGLFFFGLGATKGVD